MPADAAIPENSDQLARAAAMRGDWPAALDLWSDWRQLHPTDPAGYLGGMVALRAQLDAGIEKPECAAELRRFALVAQNLSLDEHLRLGGFARHLHDWDTAARVYAVVRAKWPDAHDAYLGEARCLEQLGRYEQAYYVLSLRLRTGDEIFSEKAKGFLAECFRQIGQQRYKRVAGEVKEDMARYSGAKVVLLMYAHGQPYENTAKMLRESFFKQCRFECEVKVLDLEAIKKEPWYHHLEHCRNSPEMIGSRGGFYNAWKAYIVRDALHEIEEGDMVYYVDASRHFLLGFYEDINTLFRLQRDHDEILFAGSFNACLPHGLGWVGDRPELYEAVGLENQYNAYMKYPARLNSSFLLKKNAATMAFAEEWARHAVYETISLHHTADQAIFSALAYKYGFYGYNIRADLAGQFGDETPHVWGKDPNVVHRMANSCVPYYEVFSDPRRPEFWPGNLAIYI